MATLFNITVPSNTVTLDAKRSGQISFSVSNTGTRSLSALARIVPTDSSIQSWFQLDTAAPRHLDASQTVQYVVTVQVPDNAAPGDYPFRLVVADVANPDDNFGDSSTVKVTAPAPVAPTPPRPFPWWIVAVAAVVIVIIVAIIVIAVNSSNQARTNADSTSTAASVFATQTTVFLAQQGATQTAEFLGQQAATQTAQVFTTQTAAARFATQTQQARPTPTFTPRPPATITVSNSGGFFAAFSVSYNSADGFHNPSVGQFGAGSSQSITIPGDATSISVQIQVNTGFGMRDACGTFTLSTAQNASYNVSGTTFNSSCSQQ